MSIDEDGYSLLEIDCFLVVVAHFLRCAEDREQVSPMTRGIRRQKMRVYLEMQLWWEEKEGIGFCLFAVVACRF